MRNKNTILRHNPSRRNLVTTLGFPSGKMPADFTFTGEVLLHDLSGDKLGWFYIVVTESKSSFCYHRYHRKMMQQKSSKHRIFAKFGDRLIPVGRLAQAVL